MKIILFIFFLLSINCYSQYTASKGCILGNSTIASYLGQNEVAFYILTDNEISKGITITNDAVAGHTIAQQMAVYLADVNKSNYNWVIVEIGLNDLNPAESAITAIARYQLLIDTVRFYAPTSKIIAGTMTPCKQRLIDLYGAVNGLVAYQKWLDMNTAIMTTVIKIDSRTNMHTALLNDGAGNLAIRYNLGDNIHETNEARQIIGNEYRVVLKALGILPTFPQYFLTNKGFFK